MSNNTNYNIANYSKLQTKFYKNMKEGLPISYNNMMKAFPGENKINTELYNAIYKLVKAWNPSNKEIQDALMKQYSRLVELAKQQLKSQLNPKYMRATKNSNKLKVKAVLASELAKCEKRADESPYEFRSPICAAFISAMFTIEREINPPPPPPTPPPSSPYQERRTLHDDIAVSNYDNGGY